MDGKLRTKARLDGELMIDNRGPGLPAGFIAAARRQGMQIVDPGAGGLAELKTLTCAHCGTVQIENPLRARPRGYCRRCDRYLCDACVGTAQAHGYAHVPFKQVIDELRELSFRIENNYTPLTRLTPLPLRG